MFYPHYMVPKKVELSDFSPKFNPEKPEISTSHPKISSSRRVTSISGTGSPSASTSKDERKRSEKLVAKSQPEVLKMAGLSWFFHVCFPSTWHPKMGGEWDKMACFGPKGNFKRGISHDYCRLLTCIKKQICRVDYFGSEVLIENGEMFQIKR